MGNASSELEDIAFVRDRLAEHVKCLNDPDARDSKEYTISQDQEARAACRRLVSFVNRRDASEHAPVLMRIARGRAVEEDQSPVPEGRWIPHVANFVVSEEAENALDAIEILAVPNNELSWFDFGDLLTEHSEPPVARSFHVYAEDESDPKPKRFEPAAWHEVSKKDLDCIPPHISGAIEYGSETLYTNETSTCWLRIREVVRPEEAYHSHTYKQLTEREAAEWFVDSGAEPPPQLGNVLAEHTLSPERLSNTGGSKPCFDGTELRYGERVIATFGARATNMRPILAAFEEEGWPEHVSDPLVPKDGVDPKERLREAVRTLNRKQEFISFCSDGTGEGVLWQVRGATVGAARV